MNADINGASNIIRKVYPCKPKLKERWYRGTVNVPACVSKRKHDQIQIRKILACTNNG